MFVTASHFIDVVVRFVEDTLLFTWSYVGRRTNTAFGLGLFSVVFVYVFFKFFCKVGGSQRHGFGGSYWLS